MGAESNLMHLPPQAKLLGIDTSTAVSVAVIDASGRTLASVNLAESRKQAELLAPAVLAALGQAGLRQNELAAIGVGVGPGPFTGLRVGLVTARTMAEALGIPLWGVPSHQALAASALAAGLGPELLVVTDARRKEVYWSCYRGRGTEGDVPQLFAGPGVVRPHELAIALRASGLGPVGPGVGKSALVAVGAGAQLYATELAAHGLEIPESAAFSPETTIAQAEATAAGQSPGLVSPDAAQIARLAIASQHADTSPLYLRRPDVHTAGPGIQG